jgi:tetratricopeptide (TPR) repeat protein
VATVLTRRTAKLFAPAFGLTLIALVGVRVEELSAQTSRVDFQSYDSEFREEELGEEDPEQEAAPVLPKHFSTPDSLHSSERLLNEEPDFPPAGSFSERVPIEESLPMSNAPPTLPAASTLPPHEQLAVYFVEGGVAALSHDDFESAQENFERALEVAPLQPFGYYFLGRLAFARGDHKVALVFLRRADALLVRGDQTWRGEAARLRGAVYEDMRDYRRAYAAYRQSLQLTPTNLRAASALARLADEEPDARAAFPR